MDMSHFVTKPFIYIIVYYKTDPSRCERRIVQKRWTGHLHKNTKASRSSEKGNVRNFQSPSKLTKTCGLPRPHRGPQNRHSSKSNHPPSIIKNLATIYQFQ